MKKDIQGNIISNFEDIDVYGYFYIPSGINHEMEKFIKLPFNKARSLLTNRIEHFVNLASVWHFE